jgi:HAUS augmin-like complex subunit 1
MARAELEELRDQLRSIESQRDAVFEGLVERESPVKRRR